MVDFAGDRLSYVDIDTGEETKVEVFVACMPATDYVFATCVLTQNSEDFLFAITQCLKAMGGVPKILVPDNLKAAVTKTDPYEPGINKVMEDFANHYGCVVIPARPGHPKDKASVERDVASVYRHVHAQLRNRVFHSIDELNEAVAEHVKASAGTFAGTGLRDQELRQPEGRIQLLRLSRTRQALLQRSAPTCRQAGAGHLHTLPGQGLLRRRVRGRPQAEPQGRRVLHSEEAPGVEQQCLPRPLAPILRGQGQGRIRRAGRGRQAHVPDFQGASGDLLQWLRRTTDAPEDDTPGPRPPGLPLRLPHRLLQPQQALRTGDHPPRGGIVAEVLRPHGRHRPAHH